MMAGKAKSVVNHMGTGHNKPRPDEKPGTDGFIGFGEEAGDARIGQGDHRAVWVQGQLTCHGD